MCSLTLHSAVDYCTGCGFPLTEEDVQRVSDNIFLDIINGIDAGTVVVHRGKENLILKDKFPVRSLKQRLDAYQVASR